MNKEIEIPNGYEARIEGNKVILEPKESEDERIRNFLVELVSNDKANNYNGLYENRGVRFDDVLAYLEKQKEQKPVQSDVEKEYVRILKSIVCDFIRDKEPKGTLLYQDIFDWLEGRHIEQKEQNLNPSKSVGLEEQEPADWSEEDEEMLNSCISSIEESKENRYAYKENDGDTSYDREIAWLKSLRPSWKPSEAQLMALYSVIDDKSDTIGNEQLKLLYNDLKKLM